jgi:anti-anti-sigma factor
VFEDIYPLRWAGKQAVVTLPEDIDVSNAGQVREQLLSVINRGAAALIADMSATISCDHAGAEALARAYQRAVISGTEMRLVVTAQIIRRVLSFSGLDRLVSIYPSLEAAQAAGAPARVLDQAPARRSARAGSRLPAARPPDWNRPAVASAEVRSLVDALQDGVALVDGDGVLVLASRRLEEMFGYEHGVLLGQTVEQLFPADLQAAHRSYRAIYAEAPRTRPMGDRLVGMRKDGTTFPVEISLSPVTTAAGHFAFAAIRDVTAARQLEDLVDLARTAVTAEHRGGPSQDTVITGLFQVGLSLSAAVDLPAEVIRQRIDEALGHLDDAIGEIRDTAFATLDQTPPIPHRRKTPGPPSCNGSLANCNRSLNRAGRCPTPPARVGARAEGCSYRVPALLCSRRGPAGPGPAWPRTGGQATRKTAMPGDATVRSNSEVTTPKQPSSCRPPYGARCSPATPRPDAARVNRVRFARERRHVVRRGRYRSLSPAPAEMTKDADGQAPGQTLLMEVRPA